MTVLKVLLQGSGWTTGERDFDLLDEVLYHDGHTP